MGLRWLARKVGNPGRSLRPGEVSRMKNTSSALAYKKMRKRNRMYGKRFWGLLIGMLIVIVAFLDMKSSMWGDSISTGTSAMKGAEVMDMFHGRSLAGGGTGLLVSDSCKNLPVDEEKDTSLVLPYLLIVLVCFLGLAIVCDEFFEPSLQMISEKLGLSDDVAGATFMAAGSSAPELFTSVMGTFQRSDIGIGTIVGSAMFNILVIVAMSAAVTKGTVKVDWRPVARDVGFYLSSIGLLALVLVDQGEECVDTTLKTIVTKENITADTVNEWLENNDTVSVETFLKTNITNVKCGFGVVYWYEGLILVIAYGLYITFMVFNEKILGKCVKTSDIKVYDVSAEGNKDGQKGDSEGEKEEDDDDDDDDGPWYAIPDGKFGKIYWFLTFPMNAALHLTIPNCEKGFFKGWMLTSFFMCIVWIGFFCLVMVEMGEEIGCLLNVDPIIMGVVLLAAGTSVPDMIASMIVAKQGQADMAIANAVGSNVFDILLGLGLPWMLVPLILGDDTHVSTDGIATEVIILVGTVFLYISALVINRWAMNSIIGVVFCFLYATYITFSLVREYTKDH